VKRLLAVLLPPAGLPAPAVVPLATVPNIALKALQESDILASRKSTVCQVQNCGCFCHINPESLIGFRSSDAEMAGRRN
jgi:hypothetical protein